MTICGNDGKIILKMMPKVVSSYYNKIINKGDVFMNDLMVFNNVEFGEIRSVQVTVKFIL